MSISEQVKSQISILRSLSFECHCQWKEELEFALSDATGTIESLSAKLADMERPTEDGYAYMLPQILEYLNERICLKLKMMSKSNDETFNFGCAKAIEAFQEVRDYIEITIEEYKGKRSVEDCGGWIYCGDGKNLPEDGVDVLVWFEYFRYGEYNRLFQTKGISFTHNGKWSGFVNGQSGWNQLSIIAWQPMPEDYHEP